MPIDTNVLHYKEIFLFGSHGAEPRFLAQAMDMINTGKIDMKPFISHRFALSQAPEAFAAAESREGMRVVITP